MNKIADYGFKAFKDRDSAMDLLTADRDTSTEMALNNMAATDFDYGFSYKNRDALDKLKELGLSEAIKKSRGFVEEAPGYRKKVPDIYTTPEGAAAASSFIRRSLLPEADALERDMGVADAVAKKYQKKIGEAESQFFRRDDSIRRKLADDIILRQVSDGKPIQTAIADGKRWFDSKHLGLNEALYRHRIDKYKDKMSDVPDSVLYKRFADAIDAGVADGNTLFAFRDY